MDLLAFRGSTARFKTKRWGYVTVESVSLSAAIDGDLAVYFGRPFEQRDVLVRIHSECVFGEALESELCDCQEQLFMALGRLSSEPNGILIYLRVDGRGAGLSAKVKATDLETKGADTFESRISIGVAPEGRQFKNVGDFLTGKGVKSVKLLTNNPEKVAGLEAAGLQVRAEPLVVRSLNPYVRGLYLTKAKRFGHWIPEELQVQFPEKQLSLKFPEDAEDRLAGE